MIRRLSLTLAAVLLLSTAAPAAAETVAEGVFGADLLAGVQPPAVFHYRYEMTGSTLDKPFASKVDMEVRGTDADGQKQVFFDMFEGPNRRQFGPMVATEQNPLVIVFLQRDVVQMGNLTGGASGYFQQQIRRAFNDPAEAETIEVEFDGRTVKARRLVIHPFRDDPSIERFPQFKEKAYEFVVSDEIPGGLYRLASRTPDPKDGNVILAESVTFAGAEL